MGDDESNKPGTWENAWQKAFSEPAHTPPPRVWQGLENSLMEQQLGRYKRRLAVYQWLAAASVALLGLWAGWWLYVAAPFKQAEQPSSFASAPAAETATTPFLPYQASEPAQSRRTKADAATSAALAGTSFSQQARAYQFSLPYYRSTFVPSGRLFFSRLPVMPYLGVGAGAYASEAPAAGNNEMAELPLSLDYLASIKGDLQLQDDELRVAVQGVPVALAKKKEKKKSWQSNGDIWLGASVASTFFSPNIQAADNGVLSMVSQPKAGKGGQVYTANISSWDKKESSMPSMDFRLDATIRIRPRWMLQSSLQYGSYKVNTLAGSFVDPSDEQSYPLYYSNFNYSRLQLASPNSRRAMPVEAINTYNFVRVPIALNYVLLDRSFGLALSSGLSTDVFLGSSIEDEDNRLQEYSISAGTLSPFNRLYFSGQLGLQLYYRAGHNYLLTLEPTYQQALTDFTKARTNFNSRPSQFGVAAGFRFILR